MTIRYYQCRLRREDSEQIAWIPERGARAGVTVELLPSGEKWQVVQVFTHGMPEDVLKETQLLGRTYIKRTDA